MQIPITAMLTEGTNGLEKAASTLNVEASETTAASFMELVNALIKGAGSGAVPDDTASVAFTIPVPATGALNGASAVNAAENPPQGEFQPLEMEIDSTAQGIKVDCEGCEPVAGNTDIQAGAQVLEDELDATLLLGELLPADDMQENVKGQAAALVMTNADKTIGENPANEDIEDAEKTEAADNDCAIPAEDAYFNHEVLAAISTLKQAFLRSPVPFENAASTLKEFYKNASVETKVVLENGLSIARPFIQEAEKPLESASTVETPVEAGEEKTAQEEAFSALNTGMVESAQASIGAFDASGVIPVATTGQFNEAVEPFRNTGYLSAPAENKTSPAAPGPEETSRIESFDIKTETPRTDGVNREIFKAASGERETFKAASDDAQKAAVPTDEKSSNAGDTEADTAGAGTDPNVETHPRSAHQGKNIEATERKAVDIFAAQTKTAEVPAYEKPALETGDVKKDFSADFRLSSHIKTIKPTEAPVPGERAEADSNEKAREIDAALIKVEGAGLETGGQDSETSAGFGEQAQSTEIVGAASHGTHEKFSVDVVKEAKTVAHQAPVDGKDVFEKLGEGIRLSVKDNGGEVRMTLRPESLGELRIKMNVENNAVKAEIVVDSHAVKSVLEADSSALRDAFGQHGLSLDKYTIEVSGVNSSQANTEERGGSSERTMRESLKEFNNGRDRDGASERRHHRRNPFEDGINNDRSVDFFA